MDKVSMKFQVFFEDPFWIGICERVVENQLSVCKITFGSEPKEPELQDYILRNWYQLKFSPTTEVEVKQKAWMNPKRLQREARKQLIHIGIGTKSQQALKLQQEENKLIRQTNTKKQQEEMAERLFALKQLKKKEKHRGR